MQISTFTLQPSSAGASTDNYPSISARCELLAKAFGAARRGDLNSNIDLVDTAMNMIIDDIEQATELPKLDSETEIDNIVERVDTLCYITNRKLLIRYIT